MVAGGPWAHRNRQRAPPHPTFARDPRVVLRQPTGRPWCASGPRVATVTSDGFEVICEVEPATRPDLMHVRHQIGVLSRVSSRFLIPDNHIGRATVSSIAVAHEVALMGGSAIACLNARDRKILGFPRDLLTAPAFGVREFLFVFGGRPESGSPSDDLPLRPMIDGARTFAASPRSAPSGLRVGVTSGLGPFPAWKRAADFVFAQVTFSIPDLLEWRAS